MLLGLAPPTRLGPVLSSLSGYWAWLLLQDWALYCRVCQVTGLGSSCKTGPCIVESVRLLGLAPPTRLGPVLSSLSGYWPWLLLQDLYCRVCQVTGLGSSYKTGTCIVESVRLLALAPPTRLGPVLSSLSGYWPWLLLQDLYCRVCQVTGLGSSYKTGTCIVESVRLLALAPPTRLGPVLSSLSGYWAWLLLQDWDLYCRVCQVTGLGSSYKTGACIVESVRLLGLAPPTRLGPVLSSLSGYWPWLLLQDWDLYCRVCQVTGLGSSYKTGTCIVESVRLLGLAPPTRLGPVLSSLSGYWAWLLLQDWDLYCRVCQVTGLGSSYKTGTCIVESVRLLGLAPPTRLGPVLSSLSGYWAWLLLQDWALYCRVCQVTGLGSSYKTGTCIVESVRLLGLAPPTRLGPVLSSLSGYWAWLLLQDWDMNCRVCQVSDLACWGRPNNDTKQKI